MNAKRFFCFLFAVIWVPNLSAEPVSAAESYPVEAAAAISLDWARIRP